MGNQKKKPIFIVIAVLLAVVAIVAGILILNEINKPSELSNRINEVVQYIREGDPDKEYTFKADSDRKKDLKDAIVAIRIAEYGNKVEIADYYAELNEKIQSLRDANNKKEFENEIRNELVDIFNVLRLLINYRMERETIIEEYHRKGYDEIVKQIESYKYTGKDSTISRISELYVDYYGGVIYERDQVGRAGCLINGLVNYNCLMEKNKYDSISEISTKVSAAEFRLSESENLLPLSNVIKSKIMQMEIRLQNEK